MVRIVVTADLHYDYTETLTTPATVRSLVAQIADAAPDVVAIAGDICHGLHHFGACLDLFTRLAAPVAVLAGNHDIWRSPTEGLSSCDLLFRELPSACRTRGMTWLEDRPLVVGQTAVVGSLCWYDYSAVDPSVAMSPEALSAAKGRYNNDARWVDWPYSDREMAERLVTGLAGRLQEAAASPAVSAIVVVTHAPILEEQMSRRPYDPLWGLSNAYFGNLTAGEIVLREPKVRAVVSGHTHVARHGILERQGGGPVEYAVVGSQYGAPAFVVLEVGE